MKTKNRKKLLFTTLILILVLIAVLLFELINNNLTATKSYPEITEEYLYSICQPACVDEVIYHPNYWLCYSEEHEQAKWVATVLSAEKILLPTVERSDKFVKDH